MSWKPVARECLRHRMGRIQRCAAFSEPARYRNPQEDFGAERDVFYKLGLDIGRVL